MKCNELNLSKYLNIHSPGYVIEIYSNGEINELVFGNKTVIPKKEKTTRDTLYDIASLTKVFTATLIYIAYEEKLIDIYDSVYNIDSNFTNLKNIKIIDLLSHNQNIWTDGYLGDIKDKEEFYNLIYSSYVKDNTPTYVDVHYIILSLLLEKIYNKPFDQICDEKIFKRLNMNNTTFNPIPNNCASNNYEHKEDKVIDDIFPGQIHDTKARIANRIGLNLGNASIFTTGSDLLLFLESFFNNFLLREETINLMLKHRNTNEMNYNKLKETFHGNDVNEMYEEMVNNKMNLLLSRTYNNMGLRYRNKIDKMNDVPIKASDNSVTFSGYTGPMFTIDFDNKIIVIIMCNVIHNSRLNRYERKKKTIEIMNMIFDNITK